MNGKEGGEFYCHNFGDKGPCTRRFPTLAMALCVSVTSWCSTKTAKHRITETTPHDSPGTLVFWIQKISAKFGRDHPQWDRTGEGIMRWCSVHVRWQWHNSPTDRHSDVQLLTQEKQQLGKPENLISLSSPIMTSSMRSHRPSFTESGMSNVETISPPKQTTNSTSLAALLMS